MNPAPTVPSGGAAAGDRPGSCPTVGGMACGRLAPSPTGLLHLGHARTFRLAWERARAAWGRVVLRLDDLDGPRCRPEFVAAALEDLRWLGLDWDEGPDVGGPCGPYVQSARRPCHLEAWRRLHAAGVVYPCTRSRRDVAGAATAPHAEGEEPVFPPEFRPPAGTGAGARDPGDLDANWRFRVPDGRIVRFDDALAGRCAFTAGTDFGDFVVWRRDNVPAYQLATVADDHAMGVTEVVRGADLLVSTARQILLAEAMGWPSPAWAHAPLVCGPDGRRLAKRHAALSLASLRAAGVTPAEVWRMAAAAGGPLPGADDRGVTAGHPEASPRT